MCASALRFPHLFSPITIRGVTLRNRIMSTGHETGIVGPTGINDALVAYHRARAAGGAGLIVIEVASVHPSATFVRNSIQLYRDDAIPGYRRLARAAHEHGATLFAQLFHPGREILESIDGSAPPSWAPSAVPNERFHVMPAPIRGRWCTRSSPATETRRGACGRPASTAARSCAAWATCWRSSSIHG